MQWTRRWKFGWLAAAAVLGLAMLSGPWLVTEVRDAAMDQRLDALMPRIRHHADQANLSPWLVRSVVRAESSGNPEALSHKHAKGLMQITPITHKEVRRRFDAPDGDLYDPDYNLHVGTIYLRYLLDRFDGDRYLALAAYHMGPTRVSRILRDNPGLTGPQLVDHHANPTTRAYVHNVLNHL